LLVVGDEASKQFPVELAAFRTRQGDGMKVNLLVNYGWEWDLDGLKEGRLRSADVSRLDLIVRWGGGRRLSGFLPVQSVYADIFVLDALWPDFAAQHLGLRWLGLANRIERSEANAADRRSASMPVSATTPCPGLCPERREG
jgi:undecaprenyl diphosphate synthase